KVLKKGRGKSEVEITRLREGEVAGVMSLFEQEPRSATLRAEGAVTLWEIDQETFQRLLDTEPAISKALLTVMSRYLRRETRIVAELQSHDADNRLKVAVFDSKPYTQSIFIDCNKERFALKFFNPRLNMDTVSMASGFRVICVFVNDTIDAPVVSKLSELGVKLIALRCAGYNNVDLKACEKLGICVARVPAYSPYAVAEHAVALLLAVAKRVVVGDMKLIDC
ncbi:MAG: cyclic nucleotide-binding domain-containing protein, partial [Candidatus Thorarchaeota archaeon]